MDLAIAFVVGAIAGYAIRAYISARRRARARRHSDFPFVWADRAEGKAKPIMPRPSGKPWTEADEKQLLELVDAGKSRVEIGTVLHRTPGAVASHLRRLRRVHDNPPRVSDPETNPH
jgi:DNA-binding NarL/FixJ family response regulator